MHFQNLEMFNKIEDYYNLLEQWAEKNTADLWANSYESMGISPKVCSFFLLVG